jgi:23S rRNA (cytidine1920-2'-O)/16S rRNA (cytidine1409-2'-O)-methyltransferase
MSKPSGANRADVFLVDHGFASTRAEAQAAIKAGRVRADGKPVTKPAQMLHDGQQLVFEKEHPYVSRGALKLIAALDHFGLSPKDRICLDIGASTGGFTQVLLERGAAKVFAIDVGHDQLHKTVAADPRVTSYEGVNARDLSTDTVTEPPQAIVIDVSFISLMLALPRALEMAAKGAWLVALVKPQFEVGREHIGKGGIVRDPAGGLVAAERVAEWLASIDGWLVHGLIASPIQGGDGNREYLLAAVKA